MDPATAHIGLVPRQQIVDDHHPRAAAQGDTSSEGAGGHQGLETIAGDGVVDQARSGSRYIDRASGLPSSVAGKEGLDVGEPHLEDEALLRRPYHERSQVPETLEELLTLQGVGRKTANLTLILAFDGMGICVDTHVHRIANRWGYVETTTPDQTETALRNKLPRKHWKRINEWLVGFGQTVCKTLSPLCSQCPIDKHCPRIGVGKHR